MKKNVNRAIRFIGNSIIILTDRTSVKKDIMQAIQINIPVYSQLKIFV